MQTLTPIKNNKKIFGYPNIFLFIIGVNELSGLIFCDHLTDFHCLFTFSVFLRNFLSVLLQNMLKLLKVCCIVVGFSSKDRGVLLNCLIQFFG